MLLLVTVAAEASGTADESAAAAAVVIAVRELRKRLLYTADADCVMWLLHELLLLLLLLNLQTQVDPRSKAGEPSIQGMFKHMCQARILVWQSQAAWAQPGHEV
jgi:hypothetical protein